MAPMIFTKSIIENKEIKIFNNGDLKRDYTFICDLSEIIFRLKNKPATPNPNFDSKNPKP